MSFKKALVALLLVTSLLSLSCKYIVVPVGWDAQASSTSKGWSAVVTGVSQSEGGKVHIDVTLRNETGDWSAMQAATDKPTVLTSAGKAVNCDTVFVSTGGHRLAPGFQMRGYTAGTKYAPVTQLLYVECPGDAPASGAKLAIPYVSFSGPLDYYHQEDGKTTGTLEMELDQVSRDLTYPLFQEVESLIQPASAQVPAISNNVVSLLGVAPTDSGLEFSWQNDNPTEFALKTHIGSPPVIGADGIIYGIFEIMDLASVPVTPAGGSAQWTTTVDLPAEVEGLYILLSVESRQMRLYLNHVIDISQD